MSSEYRDAQTVVDALFVVPTHQRLQRLGASPPGEGMSHVLGLLESHGVLPLVMHNFEQAGVALDSELRDAWWPTRARAYQQDAQRSLVTLQRFLEECNKDGISVLLLKGASLTCDVYPQRWWRGQGDLDVLVKAKDVAAAARAAKRVGCLQTKSHLPQWWYRLTHFHLKLAPALPLLKEMEIHWHLHSEAHLMTVSAADLWTRALPVSVDGHRAWTLDPLDRILHLATHLDRHLDSHWPCDLSEWQSIDLGRSSSSLRLKWVVDFTAAVEAVIQDESLPPVALSDRAQEWSAERALHSALKLVQAVGTWSDQEAVSVWASEAASSLEPPTNDTGAQKSAKSSLRGEGRVHPWLDLRVDALSLLPRWIFPPKRYLIRRYGSGWRAFGFSRAYHATKVMAQVGLSAIALPFALLGSRLLRKSRSRAWAASQAPDAVLSLVAKSRGQGRSLSE